MEISNRYPKYEVKENNSLVDLLKPKKTDYDKCDSTGAMIASVVKSKIKSEQLASKVSRGEILTEDEIRYLKTKNPNLFRKAKDANNKRKALEIEVRGAKTKEEAMEIIKKAKENALKYVNAGDDTSIAFGKLQLEGIEKVKDKNSINILV